MIHPGIKAIAFDLYGTLIYVSNPRKPYNRLFEKLKLSHDSSKNVRSILLTEEFNSIEEFVYRINPSFTGDLSQIEEDINAEISSAALYPESIHVLEKLSRSYDLYLVSNLSTPFKQPVFDLGLAKHFKKLFFSCECGTMKPKAAIYKMLIDETGFRAKEIMMIGNSMESDYKGALNCELNAVLLDRGNKQPHGISSLSELITEQ